MLPNGRNTNRMSELTKKNDRMKLIAKARYEADKKLRTKYRATWDKFYEVEAKKLGINPRVTTEKTRIAELEAQVAELSAKINAAASVPTPKDIVKPKAQTISLVQDPREMSVREWARANGFDVQERGVLGRDVINAYRTAHLQAALDAI